MLISLSAFVGCTHLKGVVVEDPSGRPSRTAVLSVGRPTGIAVYEQHHVDDRGAFDFYIGPIDGSNVYLYDSSASPELTMRHVESYEMGPNMRLHLRPPTGPNPAMPVDVNINP